MTNSIQERFRVVVLDDYEGLAEAVPAFQELARKAQITLVRNRLATDAELAGALQDANCLLLVRERTRLGAQQLSLAPALRLVSQTGATFAHLDLAEINRRRIIVTYTTGDSGVSTVELTLGLILSLLRRIPLVDRRMRQEAWPAIPGQLLEGKTVGVVGLGRIGREVARLAQAFRARVVACGKTLTEERARAAGVEPLSLEELLRQSDIVTLHVRSCAETRGLIGAKELAWMKPGAFLVNTSRGPIASESAIVHALREGRIGGVGLDVYDEEPLPFDHPLRGFDNAVLLPHRGYGTVEVLQERFGHAMTNIISFLDGTPNHMLNPEVLGAPK
jgi:phosphoglycerate dehydrogenase-like enzyme